MKRLLILILTALIASWGRAQLASGPQHFVITNGIVKSVGTDFYRPPSIGMEWHTNGVPALFEEVTRRDPHHGNKYRIRIMWYPNGQKHCEWFPGYDNTMIQRRWSENGEVLDDGLHCAEHSPCEGTFSRWIRDGLTVRISYTNGVVDSCHAGSRWARGRQWETSLDDATFGGRRSFHAAFVEYSTVSNRPKVTDFARDLSEPSVLLIGDRKHHPRVDPVTGKQSIPASTYRNLFFLVPLALLEEGDLSYLRKNYNYPVLQEFINSEKYLQEKEKQSQQKSGR